MAKKYILIEVVEREIEMIEFDTFKDAQDAMKEAYDELAEEYYDGHPEEDEADIKETYAWLNNGPNHDDYDWKIFEITV